jgi:L-alanine-DL-glutamate epimerase-like enolase superfamily enzyme
MIDPIVDVRAVTADFVLPRPLRLGPLFISSRAYAFVEITTESGHSGCAYALSRGAPVSMTVNHVLRPLLLGQDADAIAARNEECIRATLSVGRVGLLVRALSLVDIALWDIKAKRAGQPLWRLLGGYQNEIPVLLVAGYLTDDTTPEELAEQLGDFARQGYRMLKLARTPEPALTRRLLEETARAVPEGCGVVVDAAWVWRSVREAAAELKSWGNALDLLWVEDPLPPENARACARLREQAKLPFAIGDEVTDLHVLRALVEAEALDVVRVDATTIGGISGALRAYHMAGAAGFEVSPHVYPEVHVHLAAALPGVLGVETFDPSGSPFDPSRSFIEGGPIYRAGCAIAPETPGLGFGLDWECIERHRTKEMQHG